MSCPNSEPRESNQPCQVRTIDPFAEYNSNVANKLSRMLSGNENVLMSVNSLRLTQDSTSITKVAVVQTGTVFKDDVFIEIAEDHRVDFRDSDNYILFDTGFDEAGYYYIVLEYTYLKSRPAPMVSIKIIKPSQRALMYPSDSLLMIGVVYVINNAGEFEIDSLDHNFDPDDTDNRREYVKTRVGTETGLPVFEQFRDQSRMAYDSETDKFWLGYENQWNEFGVGGSIISIDTTGTNVGEICYTDTAGAAVPAIATAIDTGGDVCVKAVGLEVDSSGKALTSGIGIDVPIETAQVVTAGDLLYLSSQEAGKVTSEKVTDETNPYYQVIGRALTSGDSANPIDIIFTPKAVMLEALRGQFDATTDPDPFVGWAGAGPYYRDIDISKLEITSEYSILINLWDNSTSMKIEAEDVEIISSGDTVRVWMPAPQVINWIVTASGSGSGGGGGGGGGSTDHSLLINLDYASAGHTGFLSTSPHGNGNHSATFITDAGVTYEALNTKSDVGTGSTQVARGNHTHSGLMPSGTIMVFYQASPPVGWTIKTTGFNNNSMIVLGTSYVASGGSEDARSFNPTVAATAVGNHTHTISTQANHSHSFAGTTSANSGSGKDQGGGSNDCAPHPHTHTFAGTSGASGSHNHGGGTGGSGSHSHTMTYDTYNPWYVRLIAATKD